jgi:hypothetical protein
MLVDVQTGAMNPLLAVISGGKRTKRLQVGVYECGHFSFELEFRGRQVYDLDFPDTGEIGNCGVCDSVPQLLAALPKSVIEGPGEYVIAVTPIVRAEQPAEGGWRWHKWGEYIGTRKPTTEYLHDEPEIERVLVYHVYLVSEQPKAIAQS